MAQVSKSGNTNPPSVSDSLDSWLEWLETIHPVSIDMGLDRVGLVADKLQLRPALKPLIGDTDLFRVHHTGGHARF